MCSRGEAEVEDLGGVADGAGHEVAIDLEGDVDALVAHPLGDVGDGEVVAEAVRGEEVAEAVGRHAFGDVNFVGLLDLSPPIVHAVVREGLADVLRVAEEVAVDGAVCVRLREDAEPGAGR